MLGRTRGTRAGSRSRRARRPRGWPVRRRDRAGASGSPSLRSRRSTCRRSRGLPPPARCDSEHPPTERPRRTGTCGTCPCRESRGTGSRRATSSSRPRPGCTAARPRGKEIVGELREVAPEGGAIPPHVELAGEALDHVDGGVAPVRLVVVAGRQVDPERPDVRIAERVPAQRVALEAGLLEAARGLERPGLHAADARRTPRTTGRSGSTRCPAHPHASSRSACHSAHTARLHGRRP